MFCWRPHTSFASDRTLEILHQMASDKNKSKRQLFPNAVTTDSQP
jgi:hypothetical protein